MCLIGDYDHLVLARKHYTISLNILSSQVNIRALYGLIYSCKSIIAEETKEAMTKKQ